MVTKNSIKNPTMSDGKDWNVIMRKLFYLGMLLIVLIMFSGNAFALFEWHNYEDVDQMTDATSYFAAKVDDRLDMVVNIYPQQNEARKLVLGFAGSSERWEAYFVKPQLQIRIDKHKPVTLKGRYQSESQSTIVVYPDHELLNQMKSGSKMLIKFYRSSKPSIREWDLNGFEKAWDKALTDYTEYSSRHLSKANQLRAKWVTAWQKDVDEKVDNLTLLDAGVKFNDRNECRGEDGQCGTFIIVWRHDGFDSTKLNSSVIEIAQRKTQLNTARQICNNKDLPFWSMLKIFEKIVIIYVDGNEKKYITVELTKDNLCNQ